MSRFQHQNGGFFDNNHETSALDTMHALYVAASFGAFNAIDVRATMRFISTLRNRDGGCGPAPGQKSTIEATYYYYKLQSTLTQASVDIQSITEFLKANYDSNSGLFRMSSDAEPSVEATYYAYQLLNDVEIDLTWLNAFAIRNFITDHSVDDRFKFDGVEETDAQIFGAIISKCISLTSQSFRLSSYATKRIEEGIKDGNITVAEIGKLAEALEFSDFDDTLPGETLNYIQLDNSLSSLYYSVVILARTKEINKFFEVHVIGISNDGQSVFDVEKDGITINQVFRPAIQVVSLQRWINPLFNVNVTMSVGEEQVIAEQAQFSQDYGVFTCQRITKVSRLGQLSADIEVFLYTKTSAKIIISKSFVSHISLPLDITCEASNTGDDVIELGGEVELGTQFKAILHGKVDETIELEENTKCTFAVNDPSGALLYYESIDFSNDYTFQYTLDSESPLPSGPITIVVEIGDKENSIHTHHEFKYHYSSAMAPVKVDFTEKPKLGELLKVTLIPGVEQDSQLIPFMNSKKYTSDLRDAANEAFFPLSALESHKYTMAIKCGNSIIKSIEGEVRADDKNQIVVDFETSIDENIDYATGFNIEFFFVSQENVQTPLKLANPIYINLDSKLVIDQLEGLNGGNIEYSKEIVAELVLKEKTTQKVLFPGRAYPVLLIKKNDKIVAEKAGKADESGKVTIKLPIDGAIPSGQLIAEIAVKKGNEYIPVTYNDKEIKVNYKITGKLNFEAKVNYLEDSIVIDFTTLYNNKAIDGGFFYSKIIRPDGQVVKTIDCASMMNSERLSILTEDLKGDYTVELYRLNSEEALLQTKITIQNKFFTFIKQLPIETIVLIAIFTIFGYSIKLRQSFRKA